MVKGFENMLAGSLELKEPWYIKGAQFDSEKYVIHVYVGIREDAVFACPRCGGPTTRYGYEPNERTWRHADCLFYEVRKQEQKAVDDKKKLFQHRYFFMTPKSRMTDDQLSKLTTLSKRFPKTGRAFRIVQALDEFYLCSSIREAEKKYKALYSWMRRSRLEPMKKAALTLKNHKDEILNYFHDRLTNAVCEGTNSMIQAAKRKARGFNTCEGYEAMIYLVGGKLELAVKTPL